MKKLLCVVLLIAFNISAKLSIIFASGIEKANTFKTVKQGFQIVKAGIAKAVIVIPAKAGADVKLASEELCNHIEKATKARLLIITEDAKIPANMNLIYLGACQHTLQMGLVPADLISNYFYVKVGENEMFLAGKDKMETEKESRGTLFAVYHWLDTQLGVKWLWPGEVGTVIPKTELLTSGAQGQQLIMAPFIHSRMWIGYQRHMSLSLRPNYFLDGYCLSFIFAREFGNEFKYAYGHSLIGTDFCALTGMWGTQGPNLYMAAFIINPT